MSKNMNGEYAENLKKYFNICQIEPDKSLNENEFIARLTELANQRRQIQLANNAIINGDIVPFEKGLEPNDEQLDALSDFYKSLSGEGEFYDHCMSQRVLRILRDGYAKRESWQNVIYIEYLLQYFSMIFTDHTAFKEPVECVENLGTHLVHLDRKNPEMLKVFFQFAFASIFNPLNRRDAIWRLRNVEGLAKEHYPEIFKPENVSHSAYQFALMDTINQCFVAYMDDRNTYNKTERAMLSNCLENLRYEREKVGILYQDEVGKIAILSGDFMLDNISYEQMQEGLMELFAADKVEGRLNSFNQLFTVADEYVSNIWAFSDKPQEEKILETEEMFRRAMRGFESFEKERDSTRLLSYLAQFVKTCSRNLGFSRMGNQVLKMTVYADKALYIHTLMVKRISQIILEEVLKDAPTYLNGVAGYDAAFIAKHPRPIMDLMGQAAMFHDVGKYYCLEYVENSSRNLTDDEFRAIQYHPENFDEFFKNENDEEFNCIRDCARLHHLWYNEQGGYPRKLKHTKNKPFVNILSIADSIDAATDIIGRPYTAGKTLDMLIDEFDGFRDTRYSGYIVDILKMPDVKKRIENTIYYERRHINYEVITKK